MDVHPDTVTFAVFEAASKEPKPPARSGDPRVWHSCCTSPAAAETTAAKPELREHHESIQLRDSRDLLPLHRRQRLWLPLTALLAVVLVGLLIFANPLPSYWQVAQLDLSATPSLAGIPLLILVYPPYSLLCISLSLEMAVITSSS